MDDCGCVTGGKEGWSQGWRAPLRNGLEIIRETADEVFERLGATVLADPWAARDAYVDVVIGAQDLDAFLGVHAGRPVDDEVRSTAHKLLELQRNSMSMFTSCGWFFADVGGIETVQVLRYAARTLHLLDELGQSVPRDEIMKVLDEAESNEPKTGTAADLLTGLSR